MSSKLSRTRLIETDETERNQAQVTAAEIRTWTVYTATCITARTVSSCGIGMSMMLSQFTAASLAALSAARRLPLNDVTGVHMDKQRVC